MRTCLAILFDGRAGFFMIIDNFLRFSIVEKLKNSVIITLLQKEVCE